MNSNPLRWLARVAGGIALTTGGGWAPAQAADAHLHAAQADDALAALTARARSGDKQAQLDLGIRYEEGRMAPRSVARARRLYRLAAADSGGPLVVYQAPVRRGDSGRMVQLAGRPPVSGLPEARARLARLADTADR